MVCCMPLSYLEEPQNLKYALPEEPRGQQKWGREDQGRGTVGDVRVDEDPHRAHGDYLPYEVKCAHYGIVNGESVPARVQTRNP